MQDRRCHAREFASASVPADRSGLGDGLAEADVAPETEAVSDRSKGRRAQRSGKAEKDLLLAFPYYGEARRRLGRGITPNVEACRDIAGSRAAAP